MPLRSGATTGTLSSGRLSIRWADSKTGIETDKTLSHVAIPAPDPWGGAATVSGAAGQWQAIGTHRVKDAKGKLQTATTTYWSAHRVGSG